MRVFLDTNVLASAFGTRGLCADLLQLILEQHELITGEVALTELRRVLRAKFGAPPGRVSEIETFLRGYHVEARPRRLPSLSLSDRNNIAIVTSAHNARAEMLVTGDREILALKSAAAMKILSPRAFLEFAFSARAEGKS